MMKRCGLHAVHEGHRYFHICRVAFVQFTLSIQSPFLVVLRCYLLFDHQALFEERALLDAVRDSIVVVIIGDFRVLVLRLPNYV